MFAKFINVYRKIDTHVIFVFVHVHLVSNLVKQLHPAGGGGNGRGGGGGGGGTLFSCIRSIGSGHSFLVQNFEFQYFWGGFKKIIIFDVHIYFVDMFLGSSQNWTIFRGHFYAFRVFS